jgi:hypothetical protein
MAMKKTSGGDSPLRQGARKSFWTLLISDRRRRRIAMCFWKIDQVFRFFPSGGLYRRRVMTHNYRECIVVLSINKSVEPNEEQKVLTSGFDQGSTVNTSKQVFRGIW